MNALTQRFNFTYLLTHLAHRSALCSGLLTVALGCMAPQVVSAASPSAAATLELAQDHVTQAQATISQFSDSQPAEIEAPLPTTVPDWLIPVGLTGVLTLGCLIELYRHRCYLDLDTADAPMLSSQTHTSSRPACDLHCPPDSLKEYP